jgi:hypothetical protein
MAEKIAAVGGRPWLDVQSLRGGQVIVPEIIRGLSECREAVVLVSPSSVESQWVSFEIGAVRVLNKRVTPILHHVDFNALMSVADVKAVDLNDFDDFLRDLAQRIAEERATARR